MIVLNWGVLIGFDICLSYNLSLCAYAIMWIMDKLFGVSFNGGFSLAAKSEYGFQRVESRKVNRS